jgi:CheY-like chemotaxis protein
MATMSEVVALMDDLFFQMKLAETAKQLGIAVKIAGNAEALLAEAGASTQLIIVDLNARCGPVEAVERLRAAGCAAPVVAFLSHVQVDLAERARAAGCDEVLPRSSFTKNLPAILARGKG